MSASRTRAVTSGSLSVSGRWLNSSISGAFGERAALHFARMIRSAPSTSWSSTASS